MSNSVTTVNKRSLSFTKPLLNLSGVPQGRPASHPENPCPRAVKLLLSICSISGGLLLFIFNSDTFGTSVLIISCFVTYLSLHWKSCLKPCVVMLLCRVPLYKHDCVSQWKYLSNWRIQKKNWPTSFREQIPANVTWWCHLSSMTRWFPDLTVWFLFLGGIPPSTRDVIIDCWLTKLLIINWWGTQRRFDQDHLLSAVDRSRLVTSSDALLPWVVV